ncbi:MAG: hypothetical protein LLF94_12150 [Chlamydiales bacterium]|nr:hypothetical protein [Chlamydiales bacterium]
MHSVPSFLVASASSVLEECKTWHQPGLKPLFIHEVTLEQLSSFPGITVEKVLEMDFVPGHPGPSYPYCYALPLLAGQTKAHREYCRQAMNKNRESTQKACRSFGMLAMHKWIQTTPSESYVLYYQEMGCIVEECRKKFLALQDDANALLATQVLREQTGCSFDELCPISYLYKEYR